MSSWLRRCIAALSLCAMGTGPALAVSEADLLPVDEAFALTASAPSRDRIELSWRIADGYYLYRHRITVQPNDGAFNSNPLQLPRGARHHDEFFGEVETYRQQLLAVQTGTAANGVDAVTLKVKYQGCADVGVCYPPQTRTLKVALPADAAVADDGFATLARGLAGAGRAPLLGAIAGEPLPPEQAFAFEAIVGDGNTLLLRFTPAKGYYLYRDKTSFKLGGAIGIAPGTPRWPLGVAHRDEHFGNVVVYFRQVDVPLPLRRTRADAVDIQLIATFQGCQDGGICYPPMTRSIALALPAGTITSPAPSPSAVPSAVVETSGEYAGPDGRIGAAGVTSRPAASPVEPRARRDAPGTGENSPSADVAEDSRLAAALAGNSRWLTLLGFFGAGLLLAFTPCVLPMIPILSGLIAGQGTRLGTRRALLLSLVYVVANALVFTAAGVVAGLVGANLQAAFQTPWIIVAFALVFVALALSSFGLYELQLPAALRSRLGAISDHQRGGSLAGVAAMGALSALIVGPCVAPPLAAAVLYISQSHDPVFGGAALFLLAMGMGAPLLAFGAAAGRGMPMSGPWMTTAQRVFGFIFLALAVWMLSRILPAVATLALFGLLAVAAAAWAFSATPASPRARLGSRFAGLLLMVVGAAELLGALGGGRDPLQPLAGVFGARQSPALVFRTIKSSTDLDRELQAAKAAGKPLLFDFYADWCVSCKEMEKYTFTDPEVHAALADVTLLKADVTANDTVDQALMQRFGIIGPPATLFFLEGAERRELRLVGYEKVAPFLQRVRRAAQQSPR